MVSRRGSATLMIEIIRGVIGVVLSIGVVLFMLWCLFLAGKHLWHLHTVKKKQDEIRLGRLKEENEKD